MVEKFVTWRYIHPTRACLLSLPSLPSHQVNIVDSCWMKFSFVRKISLQVQDIWKDGEFSEWLLSSLDQKSFQELIFKTFKNRKCSGCIDRQQVRLIDWNIFFFKLKLLIFRRWYQMWMKTTTIKQRFGWIFFVVSRSFVLLWNSMSKLIPNQCACKLLIKIAAAYFHAHEQLCHSVFLCFSPLFSSSQDIHLWKLY